MKDPVDIVPTKAPIRGVPVGERLTLPWRYARVLLLTNRAEMAPDKPARPPRKKRARKKRARKSTSKRTYRRRDMRAED